MSATQTHSRWEWYCWPPVKTFGVGRPNSERREPSVPPRTSSRFGSRPARRDRFVRELDRARDLVEVLASCCGTAAGSRPRRRRPRRPSSARARRSSRASPRRSRAGSCAPRRSRRRPRCGCGWMNLRVPRFARARARAATLATKSAARLDRVDEDVLGIPGVDGAAAEVHARLERRERLVLDLAGGAAVERVGDLGAERARRRSCRRRGRSPRRG